jgi:hypothetical protein
MNDPNATRDGDLKEPVGARQFDTDDGADPFAAWDDVGGEG